MFVYIAEDIPWCDERVKLFYNRRYVVSTSLKLDN